VSDDAWSALVSGWFPGLVERSLRQATWPEIEDHRERIKGWRGQVTAATIHRRDDHGLGASESSLRRFISANFDEEVAQAAVRVLRDTPPAGRGGPGRLRASSASALCSTPAGPTGLYSPPSDQTPLRSEAPRILLTRTKQFALGAGSAGDQT